MGLPKPAKYRTFSPQFAPTPGRAGAARHGYMIVMQWIGACIGFGMRLKAAGVELWGDPAAVPPWDYTRAKPKN